MSNMENLIHRWQGNTLEHAMTTRRVIWLGGARQCGKTTLVKKWSMGSATYRTLDDASFLNIAETDPAGFVRLGDGTLIIDEIQRAPALLSAVKMVVDANNRTGQYLLTGSANIRTLPHAQESLAGRMGIVRLRPVTEGELRGAQPDFLDRAFAGSFEGAEIDRSTLLQLAFRGGYPEAIRLPAEERGRWYRDYVDALLTRDLRDIARITRHHAIKELIHVLAAWSGKLMDTAAIGAGLSLNRATLETYINALETLYLVERVPPWTHTDYQRAGRQQKLFMTDGGLMAAVLRWDVEQIMFDGDRSGKLVETFVHNEIAAQIDAAADRYALYHYRDRERREIDFIVERSDQALLGIEVKAGSAISHNDFRHLTWFRDHIAKDRPFLGVVLYTGTVPGRMGDNLWAVPIGNLWRVT